MAKSGITGLGTLKSKSFFINFSTGKKKNKNPKENKIAREILIIGICAYVITTTFLTPVSMGLNKRLLFFFFLIANLTNIRVKKYYGLYFFIVRVFATTLTDEKAIAAAAKVGFKSQPVKGYKMPAAIGIPTML